MAIVLRLCKIDEHGFLVCLKYSVWGSGRNRFKAWKIGDHLAFIVDKSIAGLAKVSGKPYYTEKVIWRNGIFPYRLPLKFIHVLSKEDRVPLEGEVMDILTSAWGKHYSWGLVMMKALPEKGAERIMLLVRSRPNSLSWYMKNVDTLLAEVSNKVNSIG